MLIDLLGALNLSEVLFTELDFRIRKPVTAVQCFRSQNGLTMYPVCPKCGCSFGREYQHFCDRCGQRLNWDGFENCIVILPGAGEKNLKNTDDLSSDRR